LFYILLLRYYNWLKSRRKLSNSSVNGLYFIEQLPLRSHESISSEISSKGKKAASGLAVSLAMVCSALFSLH
jgi:hypothetical protein